MFNGIPVFPKLPILINCKGLVMCEKESDQLSASITSISRKRKWFQRFSNGILFIFNDRWILCVKQRYQDLLKCMVMGNHKEKMTELAKMSTYF